MDREQFMKLPLNRILFEVMYKTKQEHFGPVLRQYQVNDKELHEALWDELGIPGIEVRIANTAIDFLIDCCDAGKDIQDTLRHMIKHMILASGVFYTNVAPDAVCTGDFEIPKTE